jgi:hypothetical protein
MWVSFVEASFGWSEDCMEPAASRAQRCRYLEMIGEIRFCEHQYDLDSNISKILRHDNLLQTKIGE